MGAGNALQSLVPQQSEEDDGFVPLVPLRFLGMGLFIAWLCCTHIVAVFPGSGYEMAPRNAYDTAMRVFDIASFLVLALVAMGLGSIGRHAVLCVASVVLSAAGTLVVGWVLLPLAVAPAWLWAVSVLAAPGGAVLFCLWAEVYAQLGPTRTMVYGACSCIVAAVLAFLVCTMRPPYAVAATSLLPLLSLGCALASAQLVPREPQRASGTRYPVPGKLILIMAIAGFLSGVSALAMENVEGVGAMFRVLATALAGVVILAMAIVRRDRMDVRFLARVSLPLAILALLLIPLGGVGLGYVAAFLLKLAYVWFTFFVLILLASICYRFEVPTLRIFALARAASEFGILAGVALRRFLHLGDYLANPAFPMVFSLAGIVIVLCCVLVWKSEKSVNGDWGAAGVAVETNQQVVSSRERFMARCERMAAERNLTAREAEVMALIAQGKTRREIEQELFLSENTVKTHARHLYAKLGVATKADVIALFRE